MIKEKYALLDTDFISKTHLIRKDDQNKMIDRVMELPEYRFYCHEQIKTELARHDIGDSPEWLETKISDGAVHCISDEEIIVSSVSLFGATPFKLDGGDYPYS